TLRWYHGRGEFAHAFTFDQFPGRAFVHFRVRAVGRLHLSATHLTAACPLVPLIAGMLRLFFAPTHSSSLPFPRNLAMAEDAVFPDAPLTPTERRLWDTLRAQPGRVFSRRELVA